MAKTAESAAQKLAVEKPKLTAEQAIKEIRNLRAGGLHVGNDAYTDLLLAEYDRLLVAYQILQEDVDALESSDDAYEAVGEPSTVQEGVPS